MMPHLRNVALPWFDAHGATLNDATSFRHMIRLVEREAEEVRRNRPHYVAAGFADVVAECDADLAAADDLLARMRARLDTILAPAVPT